eukprot:12390229-Ditylum_brightwellii.AAC.1
MKIDNKNLEFRNQNHENKPLPVAFYILDSEKKLSPSDYHIYKQRNNPKDKKLAVHNLVVNCYEVGTP